MEVEIVPQRPSFSTEVANSHLEIERNRIDTMRVSFVKGNSFVPKLDNERIKKVIQQLLDNQTKIPFVKKENDIDMQSRREKQDHAIIESIDTPGASPNSTDNEVEEIFSKTCVCNSKTILKKKKRSTNAESKKKKKRSDINVEEFIQQILTDQANMRVAKKRSREKSSTTNQNKTKKQSPKMQSINQPHMSAEQDFDTEKLIQEILVEQTKSLDASKKRKTKKKKKHRTSPSMKTPNSTDDEAEQIIQEILRNHTKETVKKWKSKTKSTKKNQLPTISSMYTPCTSPNSSDIENTEELIQKILADQIQHIHVTKKKKSSLLKVVASCKEPLE